MGTATVGVTANDAAVVGVADLAVVRPQDLDPDPAPNPVPDPPQKGNPEVVPGKEFCTNFCFCHYFKVETILKGSDPITFPFSENSNCGQESLLEV